MKLSFLFSPIYIFPKQEDYIYTQVTSCAFNFYSQLSKTRTITILPSFFFQNERCNHNHYLTIPSYPTQPYPSISSPMLPRTKIRMPPEDHSINYGHKLQQKKKKISEKITKTTKKVTSIPLFIITKNQ